MQLGIIKKNGKIATIKDFTGEMTRGEVAHIIAELELMKAELIEIYADDKYFDMETEDIEITPIFPQDEEDDE